MNQQLTPNIRHNGTMHTQIVLYCLLVINLLTFIAYGHDKWKAQHPRTVCRVTPQGTEAFRSYIKALKKYLSAGKS